MKKETIAKGLVFSLLIPIFLAPNINIGSAAKLSMQERVKEYYAEKNKGFYEEEINETDPAAPQNSIDNKIDVINDDTERLLKETKELRKKLESLLTKKFAIKKEKPKPVEEAEEQIIKNVDVVDVFSPAEEPTTLPTKEINVPIIENTLLDGIEPYTATEDARIFEYQAGATYNITTQPGYLTDVILGPGEVPERINVGDTQRWYIKTEMSNTKQCHIYIKPIQVGIKTNVIIVTNRRNYHLTVEADNYFDPAVRWDYPNTLLALEENDDVETPGVLMEVESVDKLNFEYAISKAKKYDWTPEFVFDDGFRTFIKLPEDKVHDFVPAIFERRGNSLILLNYSIANDSFVLEDTYRNIEMRIDNQIVRIKKQTDF